MDLKDINFLVNCYSCNDLLNTRLFLKDLDNKNDVVIILKCDNMECFIDENTNHLIPFCCKCDKELILNSNQPERSKREDSCDCNKLFDQLKEYIDWIETTASQGECGPYIWDADKILQKLEMRCSEHCGNTVREAQ